MSQMNVKIPFKFNDENGVETQYYAGIQEIPAPADIHFWTLLHAEPIETVNDIESKPKKRAR